MQKNKIKQQIEERLEIRMANEEWLILKQKIGILSNWKRTSVRTYTITFK